MSNQRYTPEFKDEAVGQVTERGYSIAEVACAAFFEDDFMHRRMGTKKIYSRTDSQNGA